MSDSSSPTPDEPRADLAVELRLARRVAERLEAIPGVVAVALGGSLARGRARPDSDIDLGLYYRSEAPLDIAALRRVAADLDDAGTGDAVTESGAWGPWIDGGAWLRVEGRRVDWLYRDLDRMEEIAALAARGEISRHAQPGHPHGFHSHIYLGEIHHNRALSDPRGELARLKARLEPYPPRLARALVEGHLWQAGFALDASEKAAARGDVGYVAGCLFECAYCLVQVLFAHNGRWFVNEKGALDETRGFERVPADFADAVTDVLARPGASSGALERSRRTMRRLVDSVAELAGRSPGGSA